MAAIAMRATNKMSVTRMYPRSWRRCGFGMGWGRVTFFSVSARNCATQNLISSAARDVASYVSTACLSYPAVRGMLWRLLLSTSSISTEVGEMRTTL